MTLSPEVVIDTRGDVASRADGRHPNAARTVVRLTVDAVADLERIVSKGDPQVVRWALKKMIHLEQNPEAGDALLGGLMGWRKLTVGDREWRLVWRVTHDEAGTVIVDVAEVWAFGARSEGEVYAEMRTRVAAAPPTSHTTALAEVLTTLGRLSEDLEAKPEPARPEPPPRWLRESLLYVVRLPAAEVEDLSLREAERVWLEYTTGRGK